MDRRGPISRILQRAFEYRDHSISEQEIDAIIARHRQSVAQAAAEPTLSPSRPAVQPRVFGKRTHH